MLQFMSLVLFSSFVLRGDAVSAAKHLACSGDLVCLDSYSVVGPGVLELRLTAQHLAPGPIREYTEAEFPGSSRAVAAADYVGDQYSSSYLYTGTRGSGIIHGFALPDEGSKKMLKEFDTLTGTKLDTVWADSVNSYTLASSSNSAYASPANPTLVSRKSNHAEWGYQGAFWDTGANGDKFPGSSQIGGSMAWTVNHTLTLTFAGGVAFGHDYTLSMVGGDASATLSTISITLDLLARDEADLLSEAIHVNQIGFLPVGRAPGGTGLQGAATHLAGGQCRHQGTGCYRQLGGNAARPGKRVREPLPQFKQLRVGERVRNRPGRHGRATAA